MAMLAVAGCATASAETPVAIVPAGSICSQPPLDAFKGRVATQQVGADMLAASGTRVLRWVQPGMMVTMDYREDRITVHLDAANRIERASCG
jgi:hypothetical protein